MTYREFIGLGNGIYERRYKKILRHFFKVMWEKLINGDTIVLPHRLGTISLREGEVPFDKPEKLKVDFQATKEFWKEHPELEKEQYIFHTNDHTMGKYCFFRHSHKNASSSAMIYSLRSPKSIRKVYSEAFKNGKRY